MLLHITSTPHHPRCILGATKGVKGSGIRVYDAVCLTTGLKTVYAQLLPLSVMYYLCVPRALALGLRTGSRGHCNGVHFSLGLGVRIGVTPGAFG